MGEKYFPHLYIPRKFLVETDMMKTIFFPPGEVYDALKEDSTRDYYFAGELQSTDNGIRRQLLQEFEQFARRMRLQYIYHGQDKEPHPFHVKSNWMPPAQQSITLESYLESVKTQLVDIRINKPKNNLSRNEMAALKELKNNSAINLEKADNGTTTVIMNKSNKIQEAEVQLENREHYKPLGAPMVNTTQTKVNHIIDKLHRGKHVDDMTKQMAFSNHQPA